MDNLINQLIEKYYKLGNTDDYLMKCKKKIVLPPAVQIFSKERLSTVIEDNLGAIWPSARWIFRYHNVKNGEFNVDYTSTLMVSKIANVYYLQHEFSVDNKDNLSITPALEGFDTQPYTRLQQELEKIVDDNFKDMKYIKLSYAQLNKAINGIDFPVDITLFGEQVTIEYLLFHDLLELCPD